jgi:hypothetical protein
VHANVRTIEGSIIVLLLQILFVLLSTSLAEMIHSQSGGSGIWYNFPSIRRGHPLVLPLIGKATVYGTLYNTPCDLAIE